MEEHVQKYDNVWAHDVKNNEIYIVEAKSGLKGYYCMGCGKPMQAVRSEIQGRKQFFRHHHNGLPGERQCFYSDETFRHKYAKEYLQRVKRIKVPDLYKYPPKGISGIPMLISKSKFIEASYVRTELFFYENEDGEIKYSETFNLDEQFLLVKPDVIFFDQENKPILFIEIVATHKVKDDKKTKLKRLGIDAVQVSIPQADKMEIERTFQNTSRTKWIYNYEYERTEYISIPNGASEGIPSIDEIQRKLFEETFECRKVQIRNLIRSIEGLLGTKRYRDAKLYLESEILRTEDNTRKYRENEKVLQDKLREEVLGRHNERRTRLDNEKERFRIEDNEFREGKARWYRDQESEIKQEVDRYEEEYRNGFESKTRELEERYNRKRKDINGQLKEIDRKLGEIRDEQERVRDTIGRLEQDRRRDWSTEESFRGSEGRIKSSIDNEIRIIEGFKTQINNIEREEREFNESKFESIKSIERKFREEEEHIDTETEREFRPIEELESELRKRFEQLREGITQATKNRNYSELQPSREFKESIADNGKLGILKEVSELFRRVKYAQECIKTGAYKNWHE